MALARHDAGQGHERRRAEPKLIRAQDRRHHHVLARLHSSVGSEAHAAAQAIGQQGLVSFRQPEFPGRGGILDGAERARARPTVVPADEHHVCVGLSHAAGHGADSRLRNQFHSDPRPRIDLTQVVDELRQVLDRVDVVMRRGRNERDAFDRAAHARNERRHLVRGQLAALAGFRALRHLDLELFGPHQVFGRHAEARRGHLFDLVRG